MTLIGPSTCHETASYIKSDSQSRAGHLLKSKQRTTLRRLIIGDLNPFCTRPDPRAIATPYPRVATKYLESDNHIPTAISRRHLSTHRFHQLICVSGRTMCRSTGRISAVRYGRAASWGGWCRPRVILPLAPSSSFLLSPAPRNLVARDCLRRTVDSDGSSGVTDLEAQSRCALHATVVICCHVVRRPHRSHHRITCPHGTMRRS